MRASPTKKIRLIEEGTALQMRSMYLLVRNAAKAPDGKPTHAVRGKEAVLLHTTPSGVSRRKFVKVQTVGGSYWADKNTGTLYCPTSGRCLGSNKMSVAV